MHILPVSLKVYGHKDSAIEKYRECDTKIIQILDKLGDSPLKIANTLKEQGILGVRYGKNTPLINYIQKEIPKIVDAWMYGNEGISYILDGTSKNYWPITMGYRMEGHFIAISHNLSLFTYQFELCQKYDYLVKK